MEASYIQLDLFEQFDVPFHPVELDELRAGVDKLRKGLFSRLDKQQQRIKSLEEAINGLAVELERMKSPALSAIDD